MVKCQSLIKKLFNDNNQPEYAVEYIIEILLYFMHKHLRFIKMTHNSALVYISLLFYKRQSVHCVHMYDTIILFIRYNVRGAYMNKYATAACLLC